MLNKLPDLIDPIYFAQHEKFYDMAVPLSLFPRLREQVLSEGKLVQVSVQFYRQAKLRAPAFKLTLETSLVLNCQRSLESFDHPIHSEISGVFVESLAMAKDIPSDFEVYEFVGGKISLYEIIEEELLLNIPMAPIDSTRQMAYDNAEQEIALVESEITQKENPFAALKALQKK